MIAVDTNVLVYRLDRSEAEKRQIARDLIQELSRSTQALLLWQVAGELVSQLTYWHRQDLISRADIREFAEEVQQLFPLSLPSRNCIGTALDLAERYSLSHWDSMLLAACQEADVTTLYTEDMGASRTIDGIELVNPFLKSVPGQTPT